MISKIKAHSILSNYIEDTCCENDICVTFDDAISPSNYVILKVDKYYNSLNVKTRPASIDCLIIRDCINNGLGLTLVELKKIENANGFDTKNIKEKFDTTLFDFIKKRFTTPLDVEYLDIKLYFVTKQEIYKRDLGLKMEVLINTRFDFNDRKLMVTPKMPNPTIKNCYG